jgi:hypothetical protein
MLIPVFIVKFYSLLLTYVKYIWASSHYIMSLFVFLCQYWACLCNVCYLVWLLTVCTIIIIIIILLSLVSGLLSFVLLILKQQWSPLLKLQVSSCSATHVMRDIPSIAMFCSESNEFFPGMAFRFFFKPFVIIQVAQVYYLYDHTLPVPHTFPLIWSFSELHLFLYTSVQLFEIWYTVYYCF